MSTPSKFDPRPCTHIKANGVRCGSPAMKNQYYCFFHASLVKVIPRRIDARIKPDSMLEDPDAIQVSLMELLQEVRQQTIDYKRASLMLKMLHLAYRNVKNLTFEKPSTKRNAVREMPDYLAQAFDEHPEWGPPLTKEEVHPPAKDPEPADPVPSITSASTAPTQVSEPNSVMHQVSPDQPDLSSNPPKPDAIANTHLSLQSVSAAASVESVESPISPVLLATADNQARPVLPHGKNQLTADYMREIREIRRALDAVPGAYKGNWRDVKKLFEFAELFPAKSKARRRGTQASRARAPAPHTKPPSFARSGQPGAAAVPTCTVLCTGESRPLQKRQGAGHSVRTGSNKPPPHLKCTMPP